MQLTRNKLHIAMWDDEAERIEAALYTALDLFDAYRKEKADEAEDNTERWNAVLEAEGILEKLHAKLSESNPRPAVRQQVGDVRAELLKLVGGA